MTAEDVLEILGRLDAGGIEWWLDGGWGVDALLGEQTRGHDDHDDVDWNDVRLLCERFGLDLPAPHPPGFIHEKRSTTPPPEGT